MANSDSVLLQSIKYVLIFLVALFALFCFTIYMLPPLPLPVEIETAVKNTQTTNTQCQSCHTTSGPLESLPKYIKAKTIEDMHGNKIELNFELYCRVSGNLAVLAKNDQDILPTVLEGLKGSESFEKHVLWLNSVASFGIANSDLSDYDLFVQVYEYCTNSKFAQSAFLETLDGEGF